MSIEAKVKTIIKDVDYEPREHGIALTNMKSLKQRVDVSNLYESQKFWYAVQELIESPKMSAYAQLTKWRSLGKQMVAHCKELEELAMGYQRQIDRMNSLSFERNGEKWTDEEDGHLIELVCDGNTPMVELCTIFGRSPGAIQTRISYLVGIRRVSSEIAGKFIGTLNGAKIEGNIKGNLIKKG